MKTLLLIALLAAPPGFRPGSEWALLGVDYQLTADVTSDAQGNIYFSDAQNNRILKVDTQGKIIVWKQPANGTHGLALGRDGKLYAGQHDLKRIATFDVQGQESVAAEDAQTHHFSAGAAGVIYFTQAPLGMVWMVDGKGPKTLVHKGLQWPRGVKPTPDLRRLIVGETKTTWMWIFDLDRDGRPSNPRHFCELRSDGKQSPDSGGMDFDVDGNLYVATNIGIQVCNKQGKLIAVLDHPERTELAGLLFAGPKREWLYAHTWNKLYRRQLNRPGFKLPSSQVLR